METQPKKRNSYKSYIVIANGKTYGNPRKAAKTLGFDCQCIYGRIQYLDIDETTDTLKMTIKGIEITVNILRY